MFRLASCMAVLVVLFAASGGAAETIFQDDFQSEPHVSIMNYTGFNNWDVTGGGVDLLYKLEGEFQGPGLFVDLDGTNMPAGRLSSKTAFTLAPGNYTLSFDLAGPWGGTPSDSVVVSLGTVYSETFTLQQRDPWQTFVRTIDVATATTGNLSFQDTGADQNGVYLDNVRLIPEPSTLVLLGIGAIGLLAYAWRRCGSGRHRSADFFRCNEGVGKVAAGCNPGSLSDPRMSKGTENAGVDRQ